MYAYDFAKNEGLHIYANEPDMGPILRNMPHYPMWAPDGKSLAFMASAPEGLTLFVTEPQSDANERMVLVSAPLYASWSADSRRLVVHGGVDLFLVDVAEETVEDLNVRAISYRVPAFRPSGDGVVYVSEDQLGEVSLFMSDSNQGTKTLLGHSTGELAFLWSPNGESLAVAHSRPPGGTFYGGLSIHSPDGVKQQTRIDEELLAFFWSPDSTKLAYVTVSLVQESLRWMVLDVGSGSSWPLTDFLPSSAQLTIFRFFDQFAYSHGPWSPDSSALVFSGNLSGGAVSASMNLQSQAQVIVYRRRSRPVFTGYRGWLPGRLVAVVKSSSGSLGRNAQARKIFDPIADSYEGPARLFSISQYGRWRRFLISQLRLPPHAKVLDVCTGTGLVAMEIAREAPCSVVGLDLSGPMLEKAKRNLRDSELASSIGLVNGRAESLPFDDHSFDAVVFTFLLRYVESPQATIKEMGRVLRPGGQMASYRLFRASKPHRPRDVADAHASHTASGDQVHIAGMEISGLLSGSQHIQFL